ncbi:hypothetical protein [Nonomuraea rubra]|uniref:Uncharacterized protein n=1 Tax=Nonomuraea rubra TaxID=46180 RepID=A0A7X0U0W0_9ACTN|nr:hypothetical protein [Nonomuraea rubra]MBB6550770.1 hypothetical protein [Nonomuraea rubra]
MSKEPAPTGRYRPVGAVVHLLATAIEEVRGLSSMSGVLAGAAYPLLLAWRRALACG